MTGIVVCLAAAALATANTASSEPESGLDTGADIPAVDALFAAWDVPDSPGCGLAVARNGAPVYTRGYGYANLDYNLPITPRTVFDVGSVTKQFTAAVLTLLALDGKLSLDDDVRQWLPELPAYERPITLRHMLHHTSGLRDYLNLFPLAGRNDYTPISLDQILAMMARQRALVFAPGERYLYSNTAYMLLAKVIERAGGQSLSELAAERFFGPLGMQSSVMYADFEAIIPDRATGYARDAAGRPRVVHNYNFDVPGDGQLYTTMEDLLRWDEYLHGAGKPAIHAPMLTEGVLNNSQPIGYAQGIRLDAYRGQRTVGHSGSSWGFETQLLRFVDPGLTIAISCNDSSADPSNLALRVADHFLAVELGPQDQEEEAISDERSFEPVSELPVLTPSQRARFAGTYFSPELDAIYRISDRDDELVVQIEQEPPLELSPVAEDRFEFDFHPPGWPGPTRVVLAFQRDTAGVLTGFGLSSGSERDIRFARMERHFSKTNG